MCDAPEHCNGEMFTWKTADAPAHPGKSVGQLLLESMKKHAATVTKPAQIDGLTGSTKTYAEILDEIVQAAVGWRSLGIGVSDTIAIFTRHNPHKSTALLGAALAGITVATMLPTANEVELRRLAGLVPFRAMVCEPSNLQVALKVVPKGVPIFVTDESTGMEGDPGVFAVPELVRRGIAANVDVKTYQAADVGDLREHIAFVVFSSGTSGLSKGVMCTNYGIVANMLLDTWSVLASDTVLVTSPVSWVTGLFYTFIPIMLGATRVLYNYTNESDCLDKIRKYKITMVFMAPARYFQVAGLVKNLRMKGVDVNLSHWRLAAAGGAAMTADLQKTCSETLGTSIVQIYGCTEHLTMCRDTIPPRYGSVGKPAAGVQFRLVDIRTGCDITEPNKEGELRVKSPSFMKGYIGNPETTAKCVDEDGWYLTGDLARFDESGNLFITDRIKELLKFMNMEMTPAEIEDVLLHHPAVKDACVVGRQHDVVGDIPTAFVVLLPGMTATEHELQNLVKARLSQNKHLRGGVFFVGEMPISPNGKYDRIELRNRLSKLPPLSDQILDLGKA